MTPSPEKPERQLVCPQLRGKPTPSQQGRTQQGRARMGWDGFSKPPLPVAIDFQDSLDTWILSVF